MVQLFDALITSKMRVRILMRLFLNPGNQAYLRELAGEFDASPGHVNKELSLLKEAGLLCSEPDGRLVNYRANTEHPLFPELQSMVRKALGMDRILDSIIERVGDLEQAWLLGDYARGVDGGTVELVMVGTINRDNLDELVRKTERYIQRRIQPVVMTACQFAGEEGRTLAQPRLLLWRATDRDAT